MAREKKRGKLLSASEIGQYHYCSISWYLHRQGYKPKSTSLKKGKKEHKRLGKIMESAERRDNRSRFLAIIGGILLLVGFLIFIWELLL